MINGLSKEFAAKVAQRFSRFLSVTEPSAWERTRLALLVRWSVEDVFAEFPPDAPDRACEPDRRPGRRNAGRPRRVRNGAGATAEAQPVLKHLGRSLEGEPVLGLRSGDDACQAELDLERRAGVVP